jgi:hypothetical protein
MNLHAPSTGNGRRGCRLALCLVAAGLAAAPALSGCTTGAGEQGAAPATAPERWVQAYHDALRQGPINLAPFYAPDAVLDATALSQPLARRPEDLIRTMDLLFPVTSAKADTRDTRRLYVSTDGLVESSDQHDRAAASPRRVASLYTFSGTGIAEETLALSELSWRRAHSEDERILAPHVLAQEYVRAWSAGSLAAVRALYAADAALTDSLRGVEVRSAASIGELAAGDAAQGALPGASLVSLPDYGGPAVYVTADPDPASDEPVRTVVMLLDAPAVAGCSGSMAVLARLDDAGLIAQETRYHATSALSGCGWLADDGTPSGGSPATGSGSSTAATPWWEAVPIPSPVAKQATGTLQLGDTEVPLFNTADGMERLVEWGIERFTAARLAAPKVSEVAFYPPTIDLCAGVSGLASGGALSLCFDRRLTCANDDCTRWNPAPRKILLHELGHAWMADNLTRETIDAFTAESGLPSWASSDDWGQRAVELAAATLAWGLMDAEESVSPQFGPRSCDELASLFRTLTGQPAPAAATCTD